MSQSTFHLGLCMAGSVSAGAYTAGVLDYLTEALRAWERDKANPDITNIPRHDVVIDLLCGTSGGGMAAAMSLFALQDKNLEPVRLKANGRDYDKVSNNIFWNSWVEMTNQDVFLQMLQRGDIKDDYVPSAFNSTFIDEIADSFKEYVKQLSKQNPAHPAYLCEEAELFVTLFNVTGISYKLHTKAAGSSGDQYVSEHRDIAHFGWHETYKAGTGRMELTFAQPNLDKHLDVMINAAKATGAFPVGLKARKIAREAKYIWQNKFFNYDGAFSKDNISLGACVKKDDDLYLSLNADGGTANNEPIELAGEVMQEIRKSHSKYNPEDTVNNSSVILIDPFPSLGTEITRPENRADNLLDYAGGLIGAMRSQLLFDAKKALDIYTTRNYSLHLIAPSSDKAKKPEYAIACGALGGFGGLLSREFRVHDYFLGRHNCQSFLRKYLAVNINEEEGTEEYEKVASVIKAYKANPDAVARFKYEKNGITWLPIIPDMTIQKGGDVANRYMEEPVYKLYKLPENYLEKYRRDMKNRFGDILNNLTGVKGFMRAVMWAGAGLGKGTIATKVLDYIADDLKLRELMDGEMKEKPKVAQDCNDKTPFADM